MPKEEPPQALADPMGAQVSSSATAGAPSPKAAPSASPPAASREEITVSGRLSDIGFGRYQLQVFFLCACFICSECSMISMFSGTVKAISIEYQLESMLEKSMLQTLTFIGMGLGNMAGGPLGDTFGRRLPLLVATLGIAGSSVALALTSGIRYMYVLRFVCGCFVGLGIPTAFITVSEVVPTDYRAVCTAAMGVSWCLGELWAALGLKIAMPELLYGDWRAMTLWAAIPAICLLLFGALSPVSRVDTPYFLASKRRTGEALRALSFIAEVNRKPELKTSGREFLLTDSPEKGMTFALACPLIFESPMSRYTVALAFLQFNKDFTLYGMLVFWPLAWALLDLPGDMDSSTELMLTALAGIPGVALAMYLMSTGRRRPTLIASALICVVALLIINELLQGKEFGLLGVAMFKFVFPTQQMITLLYPNEVYPTPIRGWGFALVAALGRAGCIVAPILIIKSTTLFLNIGALLGLGSVACVFLLPETRDRELPELRKELGGLSEYKTFSGPASSP